MRKRWLIATLALALLSTQALALTLSEARQQGRVGETLNGLQLLGAVLIMAGLYINVFGLRVWRTGAVPR